MKYKISILLVLIMPLLTCQSVWGEYGGIDTTKIGISEDDEFTYYVDKYDVVGEYSFERRMLYNGFNYSGVSEFKLKVFSISEPTTTDLNAYCLSVYFNTTLENNPTWISCLDMFGSTVIATDWTHWEQRVENEIELFSNSEEAQVEYRNNVNFEYERQISSIYEENSFEYENFEYVSIDTYQNFRYDKATGMGLHLETKLWFYFSNGSREGYHVSISQIENESDASFVNISWIQIFAMLIIQLFVVKRRKIL